MATDETIEKTEKAEADDDEPFELVNPAPRLAGINRRQVIAAVVAWVLPTAEAAAANRKGSKRVYTSPGKFKYSGGSKSGTKTRK